MDCKVVTRRILVVLVVLVGDASVILTLRGMHLQVRVQCTHTCVGFSTGPCLVCRPAPLAELFGALSKKQVTVLKRKHDYLLTCCALTGLRCFRGASKPVPHACSGISCSCAPLSCGCTNASGALTGTGRARPGTAASRWSSSRPCVWRGACAGMGHPGPCSA